MRVLHKGDGRAMRLVRGGLQRGANGKEIWLYPFYIDEEPVSLEQMMGFLRQSREGDIHCHLDEAFTGVAAVNLATAEAYCQRVNKSLPNRSEWHAAHWQLGHGNTPVHWKEWDDARRGAMERIRRAIEGKRLDSYPALPQRSRQAMEEDWRASVRQHYTYDWFLKNPERLNRFQEKVLSAFTGVNEGFDDEMALRLAQGLVGFLSWDLSEKIRVIDAASGLSFPQLQAMLTILDEERERFLALSAKSSRDLYPLATKCEDAMIHWFYDELDHHGTPIGATPQFWSAMRQGSREDGTRQVLLGNPFSDAGWVTGKWPKMDEKSRYATGLWCVFPLFTRDDMAQVEPAPGTDYFHPSRESYDPIHTLPDELREDEA